jgi:cytochrome P450
MGKERDKEHVDGDQSTSRLTPDMRKMADHVEGVFAISKENTTRAMQARMAALSSGDQERIASCPPGPTEQAEINTWLGRLGNPNTVSDATRELVKQYGPVVCVGPMYIVGGAHEIRTIALKLKRGGAQAWMEDDIGFIALNPHTQAHESVVTSSREYLDNTAIENVVPTIVDAVRNQVDLWKSTAGENGGKIDFAGDMDKIFIQITRDLLFGKEFPEEIGLAISALLEQRGRVSPSMFRTQGEDWPEIPGFDEYGKRRRAVFEPLTQFVEKALNDSDKAKYGFLSTLFESYVDENGETVTRSVQEICATLVGMVGASAKTTNHLDQFSILELARRPELQNAMRKKAQSALFDAEGKRREGVTHQTLIELGFDWLHVFAESARLYPPLQIIPKTPVDGDVRVGNYVIPDGANIIYAILAANTDQRVFGADADVYDPNHETGNKLNELVAWGAGKEFCKGYKFSLAEGQLILALLLAELAFSIEGLTEDEATAPALPSTFDGVTTPSKDLIERILVRDAAPKAA